MKDFAVHAFWGTVYLLALFLPAFVLFLPMVFAFDVPVEKRWPFGVWAFIAVFAFIPTMLAWVVGPMDDFDAWLNRKYL